MSAEDNIPDASALPRPTGTADPAQRALRLARGTPVFGRDGTRLGELSRDGEQDGRVMMRREMGGDEITLPLDAIVSRDATGVYTLLSWRDLDAVLPPPPPGSEMGLLDALATGAEAAHADRFADDDLP